MKPRLWTQLKPVGSRLTARWDWETMSKPFSLVRMEEVATFREERDRVHGGGRDVADESSISSPSRRREHQPGYSSPSSRRLGKSRR